MRLLLLLAFTCPLAAAAPLPVGHRGLPRHAPENTLATRATNGAASPTG